MVDPSGIDAGADEGQAGTIDTGRIREMIPHRYPFLLIDRVVEVVPNERAVGIKAVALNEPFLLGHFPQRAVMPAALIIEAMAQTAAVLTVATVGMRGLSFFLAAIEKARFRRPVGPSDTLRLSVRKAKSRATVWRFAAAATVAGRLVAEATYAAMLMKA